MSKKIKIISIILSLLLVLTACSPGKPVESNTPEETPKENKGAVKASVGTGTAGGAQFVYMGGVTKIVNTYVDGVELIMEATSGSGGNVSLLQAGDLSLGSIESAIAYNAYKGIDLADGQKPFEDIRAMFSSSPTHFGIWTLDKNVKNIMDLKGKVVAVGPYGGSTDISSRNIFKHLGLECEITNLGWGDCFTALGEGRVYAVTGSSLHPSPGVIELETKADVHFVNFTEEQVQDLTTAFPYYKRVSIPKGTYKALTDKDYETIGAWQAVYTRTDVDEELIYNITKAVFEHLDVLEATHSGGKTTRLENIGEQPLPLHVGAYRYYKEKGIDVPDELIPPEAKK